ncbi:MAG: hypothetical protein D5R98_01320 [Desulfonatronovibrio sp. MSAO_Bac4]|nr:MAG: hypothetical protein D5R98_01320 [Desulfonatronovibrio sp. MSAO_Bac4]
MRLAQGLSLAVKILSLKQVSSRNQCSINLFYSTSRGLSQFSNMGLFFNVEAASSRLELNSLQDAGSTFKTVTHKFGPGPPG